MPNTRGHAINPIRSIRNRTKALWSRLTPARLRWRLALGGGRISRDQWADDAESWQSYLNMMRWTWAETREKAPDYFARLDFSVRHARGRVLEIGCGIGTMTRWLAASDNVDEVVAVDAFEKALKELRAAKLPKVVPVKSPADDLKLPEGRFDTVMMCEILEHLYADEEARLIERLRPHVDENTQYVISLPIGWLEDPTHVRAFSKDAFKKHLAKHFGPADKVDYSSGYSQVAVGMFK